MSDDALSMHVRLAGIDAWANESTTCIDRELNAAWPELAERIRERILGLSTYQLACGPGEVFRNKQLEPEVAGWVDRRVAPLIDRLVGGGPRTDGRRPGCPRLSA